MEGKSSDHDEHEGTTIDTNKLIGEKRKPIEINNHADHMTKANALDDLEKSLDDYEWGDSHERVPRIEDKLIDKKKRAKPDKTEAGATLTKPTPKKNTAIYITNLPEDTSLYELVEYFKKFGVIMDDMFTGGPRIKMYNDEQGTFKGEALIVYLREESATMAVDLLDESLFRTNTMIRVTHAQFEDINANETSSTNNNNNNVENRSGSKVDKKTWKHYMQQMNRKLAWTTNDHMSPEEEAALNAELRQRAKYARIVVLKGMFQKKDIEASPEFILELKSDLLEECERLGSVTAVHVLTDLEICTVKFQEREAASSCLKLMHGRYFDGQRLVAQLYDGSFSLKEKTDGKDEEETEERLEKFGEWLENAPDDQLQQ